MAFLTVETFQLVFVLGLVVVVFFGFVRETIPADVVALLAMGSLLVVGILDTGEVLGVFSNAAPVTIAAMFILSAALERTGVIDAAGRRITEVAAKRSPAIAVAAMMAGVILLSGFVNNTPVVVILIPVAIRLARSIGMSASKLLIPLSFASIFGGTTTLLGTSTNLLVDGVVQNSGLRSFGIFEITGAGLCFAAVGALYLAVVGRRLLPDRETLATILPDGSKRRFQTQFIIPADSSLIGKTLEEAGLSAREGVAVIDVFRDNVSQRNDLPGVRLDAGDRVVLRSHASEVLTRKAQGEIAMGGEALKRAVGPVQESEIVNMEGVVGPQSRLIGKRLVGLGLARLYGVYVIAVHRRGENVGREVEMVRFEVGDTALLEGPARGMRQMFDDGFFNNLTHTSERAIKREKAPIAIGAIALVVLLAALDVLPIAALALIAAAMVVALGCLDHREAYQSIQWDILALIFGMLALGLAMDKTGAAALIADGLAKGAGGFGPLTVLCALYALTSLLTEIMSNNAAAILLTPIAIGLAAAIGIDARPFVVAVMFAASASFATPIGYQTNTLVYNAGGYRFTDFIKVGAPLNVIMLGVAAIVIPFFFPLEPVAAAQP